MNKILFVYPYSILKAFGTSVITMSLLFYTTQVPARNLQVLLVPEPSTANVLPQTAELSAIPVAYSWLEKGLTLSLSSSVEILIDNQSVFPSCARYLCGEQDMSTLLQKVTVVTPKVNLIVLYSFDDKPTPTVSVRLLDPISFRIRFSDSLSLVDEISSANLVSLGRDMGKLVETTLRDIQPQLEYRLAFKGFLRDELNGLATWLIVNTGNSQLVLTETNINYLFFNKYFAINSSQYSLLTPLNASQVEQILNEFFAQQSVNTKVYFAYKDNQNNDFSIVREGNPYAHLFMEIVLLLIAVLLLLLWLFRRQTLHTRLSHYSKQRNADMGLLTYAKASFVMYGLQNKWLPQAHHWEQTQKESIELTELAKQSFDAGDINTARKLLAKSSQINTGNLQAIQLLKDIESLELDTKTLHDNEQWIKDKWSHAKINYRQKEILKALHCLYQAKARAQQEPLFTTQSHAIDKLVTQINQEYCTNVQALTVNEASNMNKLVLCQNEVVHIGRPANKSNGAWISPQENVFYINHNLVSRAGQQCYIKRQEGEFLLVDCDSKNGTFVNDSQLKPHQPIRIYDADLIQLGANTPFLSAKYSVKMQTNGSIIELSLDKQSMSIVDNQERYKLWPDNASAQRLRLVCMQHECCVMLNEISQEISVCELTELPHVNQGTREQDKASNSHEKSLSQLLLPLCIVRLGKNASIRPLASAIANNELSIDSVPLLGEVPLIMPCTIMYANVCIELAPYDSTNISGTQSQTITSPPIVTTP